MTPCQQVAEDLIKRLESASEGSRELDVRIWLLLFDMPIMVDGGGYGPRASAPKYKQARKIWTDDWPCWSDKVEIDSVALSLDAPHYTTSLDAALKLAPEDCDYVQYISDPSGCGWIVGDFHNGLEKHRVRGEGITDYSPALALCIAALKAREAGND